jgi:hypothetical protein
VSDFLKPQIMFRQAALVGGLLCSVVGAAAIPAASTTLTVSGSPAAMKITTATAGFPPNSATDATTTYSVKAKFSTSPQKILASLSSIMPAGMTLTIFLVAPSTPATSDGTVTLDATQRELVGNIANTILETNTITYTLSATAAAGVVTSQSRIVTLTLVAWP